MKRACESNWLYSIVCGPPPFVREPWVFSTADLVRNAAFYYGASVSHDIVVVRGELQAWLSAFRPLP